MSLQELRQDYVNNLNKFINDNTKSLQIENGVYDYCVSECNNNNIQCSEKNTLFISLYEYQVNNIIKNIDPNEHIQNKSLLKRINNNELELNIIGGMNPEELFPEHWKNLIDRKNTIEECKNYVATTDLYTCKKCKKKKMCI
jgi:hypothetical protein